MDIVKFLDIAGVPKLLHDEAVASIASAKISSKGLLAFKLKVRWLEARSLAELLDWEDDRLCLEYPSLLDKDIAPTEGTTCHGDNGPWIDTPDGPRPTSRWALSKDPNSKEYKDAVATNYWCKNEHPRSRRSVRAQYRRNGGEGKAWRLGNRIDASVGVEFWTGTVGRYTVVVVRADRSWIVKASFHLLGSLHWNTRVGYEVDNVFSGDDKPQMWFPIKGYELRAPVTWSILPGRGLNLTKKRWQKGFVKTDKATGKTYTSWPRPPVGADVD